MAIETTTVDQDFPLCALISKANGEELIGTANHFEHCFVLELPLPWPRDAFQSVHLPKDLSALFKAANARGLNLRPQAIVPDPIYSQPGYTRVILYRRPAKLFTRYEKQEYLVPEAQVVSLIEALLEQSSALSRFDPYRQATDHLREILVCTHGRRDTCCGTMGFPLYNTLRHDYAEPESLRVWRTSHTGGHRFAPTLIDFPDGRYWGRIDVDQLDRLVHHQGEVAELIDCYRGWSALTTLEQVVEREIWLQEGWHWLNYRVTSQITNEDKLANRAEVAVAFADVTGTTVGGYQATVEQRGTVLTLPSSGNGPLREEPLYRVCELNKLT
jgi:hypothetical protein